MHIIHGEEIIEEIKINLGIKNIYRYKFIIHSH